MGLLIGRKSGNRTRVLTSLVAVLALVAQPFYGVVEGNTASALGALANELRVAPVSTTVEYGTGTVEVSAKAVASAFGGWTNALALANTTTVTASVNPGTGELATTCTSGDWSTTKTTSIALGSVIEGKFCYRSSSIGTQVVNFSTSIARVNGSTPKALSNSTNVTVSDTTNPTPSFISPAVDGALTSGVTQIKVNAGDLNPHYTYIEVNKNGVWKAAATKHGSTPTWDFNTESLTDGIYTIKVNSIDYSGNGSQITRNFVIDNTDPVIQFVAPTPVGGSYVKGTVNVATTISDAHMGPYNLRIENGAPAPLSLGLDYLNLPVSGATNMYAWNTKTGSKAVADGVHTIVAVTRDQANNTATVAQQVIVDNTKPEVASFTYGNNTPAEGATLGGTVTFSVKLNEVNPAKMYVEYMEKDSAGIWRKITGKEVKNSDLAQLTINTADYAEGEHQVKVSSITDKAGNVGVTRTFKFTVDNTAPTGFVTVSNNGQPTNAPYVTATLETNEPVQTPSGWTPADANQTKFTLTHENNDDYSVSFTDVAGNSVAVPVEYTVSGIDRQNPTVTVISAARNSIGGYVISGSTSSDTASVRVKVGNFAYQPATVTGSTWTYTTPVLEDGTYATLVEATDNAGNPGSLASPYTLVVAAPIVDVTTLPQLSAINPTLTTVTTGVQTSTATGAQGNVSVATTPIAQQEEILGAQTEKKTAALPIEASESGWKIFGLAWYWWLLILAALAAAWWFIAAYRKRNAEA